MDTGQRCAFIYLNFQVDKLKLFRLVCISECWTHEESKGWRQIHVGMEQPAGTPDTETPLIEMSAEKSDKNGENSGEEKEDKIPTVQLVKTSCGDAHNIGLDVNGQPYR